MNPNAPDGQTDSPADHPALPAGLRSLWAEACEWAGWLAGMFSLDKLRAGIRRETGARLTIWLRDIEGAVRRLILAAALVFTPPAQRTPRTCASARTQPQAAGKRRPAFHIFRLNGAGETPAHTTPPGPSRPKPYGHIPFAADPLLNLGALHATSHASAPRQHAPRRRNPLDRWVRPSAPGPRLAPVRRRRHAYVQRARRAPRIAATPAARRARPRRIPESLPASLYDWRRRYDEWERAVPAPDLAARLEALAHIAANPAAAIARAARRLYAARATILPLARNASTLPGPPRRAAQFPTAGHTTDFFHRSQTALDTS